MKAHASEPFLLAKQGVDMPLVNFFSENVEQNDPFTITFALLSKFV